MTKATQAYHKRDLYNDVTVRRPVITPAQEMTLARYYAKQAVIAQWKAEGKRLRDIEVSELHREARAYLASHPELIEFATERYRYFVESGYLKPPRTRKNPTP
jgi:hypothetical protein